MILFVFKNLIGLFDLIQAAPMGDQASGVQFSPGDQFQDLTAAAGVHAAGLKDQILPYIRGRGRI